MQIPRKSIKRKRNKITRNCIFLFSISLYILQHFYNQQLAGISQLSHN